MTKRERSWLCTVQIRKQDEIPRVFQEHFRQMIPDAEPVPPDPEHDSQKDESF